MQEYQDYPESDPLQHTQKMRKRFEKLIEHPRQGVRQVDEPRAQALFETSAEVLGWTKDCLHSLRGKSRSGMALLNVERSIRPKDSSTRNEVTN